MIFTVTQEQARRPNSFALAKLLGQKSDGSVDDFAITRVADRDEDGVPVGTFTLTIPVSLDGRATRAQIQAVLDDTSPEQPPLDYDYIVERVAAYPSTGDQFDMQYHDGVNSTTTWADAIAAVKSKYPKPG